MPVHSSSAVNILRIVRLQVGERIFTTTRDTLVSESTFFASLLSGRWASNRLGDGSYFIDADPNLFEHILRYLRRGVFPLCFDLARGHDHALYDALLQESRYFGIIRLQAYLAERRYLKIVEVRRQILLAADPLDNPQVELLDQACQPGTSFNFQVSWTKKKVFVCPRRIPCHRGNPQRCGRRCHVAQPENGHQYAEVMYPRVTMVKERVIIRSELAEVPSAGRNEA
jgi:BTB/POZ domain-containing protein KCTD9